MSKRFLLPLAIAACAAAMAQPRAVSGDLVRKVHRSALLIDSHNDVPLRLAAGMEFGARSATGHTDLPRLREGGVGALFFAAYVAPGYVKENHAAAKGFEAIDAVLHGVVERYPNDFALALSARDVERARRQGKIAALIGVEGGHAIEDSLGILRDFYRLGARYLTLTHSNTNNWADSSGDTGKPEVKHHNGLTAFGKDVIREMNRLGMIVDVSHVSDKTFQDVLEVSRAPVFASHSSCRALAPLPRNLTDEMIVALAKKGGVVQINFGCEFLSREAAEGARKLWPEYTARFEAAREKYKDDPAALRAENARLEAELAARTPRATIQDVVAHIDHVVKLAGIDAVGIGTDFDGISCAPRGLDDVSRFPNLTRALLERGYSARDIRKIYGGNTLRLMRSVERAAGK